MIRAGIKLVVVLMLLLVTRSARAQSENAAELYRAAIEKLPGQFSESEQHAIDAAGTTTPDAGGAALVRTSEAALDMVRDAARVENCDWKIDYTQGPLVRLPHLHGARTAAGLMLIRAADHFENSRHAEGVADVLAVMSLGRRVGGEPVIVCRLVGNAIEQRAGVCLARSLPSLPKDQLGALERKLDALPKAPAMSETVRRETKNMSEWIRGTDELPPDLHPEAKRTVEAVWHDEAARQKGADEFDALVAHAVKMIALPDDEFHAAHAAFVDKLKGAGPIAQVFVPNLTYIRTGARELVAREAMLRCAITVVRDGPDALNKARDPAGDGPFTHEPRDAGGFVLTSAAENRQGPVSLTVGK